MTSRRVTRWMLILCLCGQALLSIASGGRMCFACGPTFCHGIELAAPIAQEQPCCENCRKKAPAPAKRPEAPAKCCCDHAIPLSGESRRIEPIVTADAHRHIVEPISLDPISLVVADPTISPPVEFVHTDPSPPLRPSDGITITRLLI